ncbi:MAG: cbb3-type cytochrome oxidase assembly protein CcoS [Halieaceae bacterium]|jgi:cbb3-type cytochrome oxidase maturation protein|uniref:cbb3-type cytochrome oxidase assembly protein CcoS n=1 Tax=Haliea alexandrii TaxID=2448162 RepID=UPI000F0B352A|nr:cbb3-type cytochrome oxidase assembly protein CcoS [Haliea alexandrii]MCR9187049.1 cbb3-type cytochrome oxidase assembly protein CcoS [Halieaceae bacterium]
MESLYLLIPIALVFCVIVIRLLIWAIDSGQYEDLDKEASRILMDEEHNSNREEPDDRGTR